MGCSIALIEAIKFDRVRIFLQVVGVTWTAATKEVSVNRVHTSVRVTIPWTYRIHTQSLSASSPAARQSSAASTKDSLVRKPMHKLTCTVHHTNTYTQTYNSSTYMYSTHTHTNTYTQTYTFMYSIVHTRTYTYTYTNLHTRQHIPTHTPIHTHTPTHTRTHIPHLYSHIHTYLHIFYLTAYMHIQLPGCLPLSCLHTYMNTQLGQN